MIRVLLFACIASLALAGCTAANIMTEAAANLTTATQVQVTTLGDAITSADEITKAANVYLAAPTTTQAQAQAVLNCLTAVHTALTTLNSDKLQGKSLVFDAYNAAVSSFHALKL